jgi:hypothetical protein
VPYDPAALGEPAEGRGRDGGDEHGGDARGRGAPAVGDVRGLHGLLTAAQAAQARGVEEGVQGPEREHEKRQRNQQL